MLDAVSVGRCDCLRRYDSFTGRDFIISFGSFTVTFSQDVPVPMVVKLEWRGGGGGGPVPRPKLRRGHPSEIVKLCF